MATSKELYLKSSDVEVKSAIMLVRSPVFEKLLVFSRSEYMQRSLPTSDQVKAINEFVSILISLPDEEAAMPEISSGIQHDLKIPERPNQQPAQQPATP